MKRALRGKAADTVLLVEGIAAEVVAVDAPGAVAEEAVAKDAAGTAVEAVAIATVNRYT
jgi:hypothetical protein